MKGRAVFHRATPELVGLLERLRLMLSRRLGAEQSRGQVVEMAIRELARKNRVR